MPGRGGAYREERALKTAKGKMTPEGRLVKRFIRTAVLLASVMILTPVLAGCGEKKESFDFDGITAVKIYTPNGSTNRVINSRKKAQSLLKQISSTTWDSDKQQIDDRLVKFSYRILCYDRDGEIRKNIMVVSDRELVYDSMVWHPDDDMKLDLDAFEKALMEQN